MSEKFKISTVRLPAQPEVTAAAETANATVPPTADTAPPAKNIPPGLLDFAGLLLLVPLGERTLRHEIKCGHIPAIRLPGGRRLLFHWDSVQKALLRFQRGGIE